MWQKRYFVLKDRVFYYYKSKADYYSNKTCKGVINFQQICVSGLYNQSDLRITITLDGSTRMFVLRAPNLQEFTTW